MVASLCMWGALLSAILQERGGTVAEEPLGPQQRLKAILQEDRLDTPQPGSQASFRPNVPLPQQLVLCTARRRHQLQPQLLLAQATSLLGDQRSFNGLPSVCVGQACAACCCRGPAITPLMASCTVGSPGSLCASTAASCLWSLADANPPSGSVHYGIRHMSCVVKE